VPAVPDTSPLVGVLEVLRDAHSQSAVVIDEHGTLTGLITFEDLMEELVGEIRDEHDPEEPEVVRPSGTDRWWVAGRARLDEVARETGIELPEGDYDTVAGLVVAELGRLATQGDVVTVAPTAGLEGEGAVARLEVLATDGYVVQEVEMTAPHHDDDGGADDGGEGGAADAEDAGGGGG
jgi:CBS domain containing-hemolysin-like protein